MEQSGILVVSDDSEFVNSLVQSWNRLRNVPEFTVSGVQGSAKLAESAVAVTDGPEALARLSGDVLLAIAITGDEPLPDVGGAARRVVQIRRSAGWADHAAALAHETMLRVEALQHVVEVERRLRESERFAALGRFISESRHGLGNALTSVLGNSELLMMDLNTELRDEVRGQLETIHTMSLKIHETLQRLSSLDMEMQVAERQAERDTLRRPAGEA